MVEFIKVWVKLNKLIKYGFFICFVVVLYGEMSNYIPENLIKKLRYCFSNVRFYKIPNGTDEI